EVANYSILDAHLAQVAGNLELWFGNLLHLLDGHAGGDFLEKQSAGCDFDERMVGHDVMNAAFAGERQRAFAVDLGRLRLYGVLPGHEGAVCPPGGGPSPPPGLCPSSRESANWRAPPSRFPPGPQIPPCRCDRRGSSRTRWRSRKTPRRESRSP